MVPPKWPQRPRTPAGLWLAIEDLRERIDTMQLADEVAERVKHEIESHRMFGFTVLQKIGGALIAAVAIANLIVSIIYATRLP